MKRDVVLSILDQAVVSAFSLAINLAFIAFATPEEFGRFVLVLAGGFFAVSAQNALIVMPLNYLLPGRAAAEATMQLSMLTSANLALIGLAAPLGTVLGLLVEADVVLYIAILAFFATALIREYARNCLIVEGSIARALRLDSVAIAFSAMAVPAGWLFMPPEAAGLFGIAFGNAAAVLLVRTDLHFELKRFTAHLIAYLDVWRDTRWALQGALQNEVEARSYVFIVEHWRNAAAVGTLQAGRVAISPLQLVISAWRRVARPKIVAALHLGRGENVSRVLWSGALLVAVLTLVYGLFLFFTWPLLQSYVFRHRYDHMETIVSLWWIYAGIVGLAAVPATLLEARRQFRLLAAVGFAVASLILGLLFSLTLIDFDLSSIIMVLAGVHLLELLLYCLLIAFPFKQTQSRPLEAGGRP